jgi:Undecaprenyl-phosphate glucose phosphotransferase
MSNSARVFGRRFHNELNFIGRVRRSIALPLHLIEPTVLAADVLLIVAASVASGICYHWLFLDRVPDALPYIAIGALAAFNFSAIQFACGAYRVTSLLNLGREIRQVILSFCAVFSILLAAAFSLKIGAVFSRGATFGFLGIGALFLVAWRAGLALLVRNALAQGAFARQRTLVIGERAALSRSSLASQLRSYGYAPGAQLELDQINRDPNGDGLRATLERAVRLAREEDFDAILLFINWQNTECIDAIVSALGVLPIPVYLIPDEKVVSYLARPYSIGDIWTAELKRAPLSRREQAVKRIIDVVGASVGILLLSPLLITVAVLIKAESRGPIIFKQRRTGFNGRVFKILKFRTMTVLEDGPVLRQAVRNDPRFTRIGRWLRRTNIDELPQLFNVLFGEMSLVGPRPHAVAHDGEYERLIATYAFRHNVKPGITGWAQCNGYRGETRTLGLMSKRVEFDLWYIKHWSVWLDVKIIVSTVTNEIRHARGY